MSRPNYAKTGKPILFGGRLRELRKKKKLTLREVAAGVGMDQAIVSKCELGQRVPTVDQVSDLAKFFGVSEKDMQAQRIAEEFRQTYEGNPRALEAIYILAERAEAGGPWGKR